VRTSSHLVHLRLAFVHLCPSLVHLCPSLVHLCPGLVQVERQLRASLDG
jgi:hypothetical protein